MTSDPPMSRTVRICRPRTFLRRRYLRCSTCECITETVLSFSAWYDATVYCCRCGESWSGGYRTERPFYQYWRRDAVREIRRMWDRATYGAPPSLSDLGIIDE